MSNYAYVFQHLTKLRQAVSHRYLITFADKEDCRICREPAQDPQVASCKHIFCKECLKSSLNNGCPSCPSERRTALTDFRRWNIVDKFQLEGFQTSTKIEALREEISFMFKYDGSAKGLVFSHFTGFLDLIGYSLEKSGIHCTKLAGSMTQKQKDDAVKKFNDESECRIFLLGMRAGGVPLDLTVASHVFLMEPGWNPAPELQAQDRVHRIGQYKPVKVVRFIIENTIEERILKLQEKKKAGIDHIIGTSSEDEELTSQDLIYLFDYHERDPPGDYHE